MTIKTGRTVYACRECTLVPDAYYSDPFFRSPKLDKLHESDKSIYTLQTGQYAYGFPLWADFFLCDIHEEKVESDIRDKSSNLPMSDVLDDWNKS